MFCKLLCHPTSVTFPLLPASANVQGPAVGGVGPIIVHEETRLFYRMSLKRRFFLKNLGKETNVVFTFKVGDTVLEEVKIFTIPKPKEDLGI